MKKLIALLLCAMFCFGLFGCRHECSFEEGWLFDEEYHWRECSDGICENYIEKDGHVYENGYCNVCERQSPTFITATQWSDALNIFEEDFQLKYTYKLGAQETTYTITRIGNNICVEYGAKDTERFYLNKNENEYFRYDYVEDKWVRTESNKEEYDSCVKIEFKDFNYEWFSYDQKKKEFFVEFVDKTVSLQNYDIINASFEFKDKKLMALKYTKVYGSYEENYKANIAYEKLQLRLPQINSELN